MEQPATAAPVVALPPKPRLRFWEIWNMGFGFPSIQFGFTRQSANVCRIFETLGAEVKAWASILSMPYALLTGALLQSKMGYYMGLFNFFIVIPQIIAAAILGVLVGKLFEGQAIYDLLFGGLSLVLAALLTLRVDDVDDEVVENPIGG